MLDQKLDYFNKKNENESDNTSRFVTFQGDQIGNLRMSLGPDEVSSKNVTFYGGVPLAQTNQTGKISQPNLQDPKLAHQYLFQRSLNSGTIDLKLKQTFDPKKKVSRGIGIPQAYIDKQDDYDPRDLDELN